MSNRRRAGISLLLAALLLLGAAGLEYRHLRAQDVQQWRVSHYLALNMQSYQPRQVCGGHHAALSLDIKGPRSDYLVELDVDGAEVFHITRRHRRWYGKGWNQELVRSCILELAPLKRVEF